MLAFLLAALASAAAQTVPGFRPPAVPLFLNSPYVNVWSAATHLFDVTPSLWNGDEVSMFSAVRVDGIAYRLMGNVNDSLPAVMMTPKQESLVVTSTQTAYSFLCGAVTVNMTFTSPLLPDDWDLLSRPAHYLTYAVAAVDGKAHKVQVYFDATGDFVAWQTEVNMSWSRVNVTGAGEPVAALKIGSTVQTPLQPGSDGDHLNWGNLYVMVADAAHGAADGATVV